METIVNRQSEAADALERLFSCDMFQVKAEVTASADSETLTEVTAQLQDAERDLSSVTKDAYYEMRRWTVSIRFSSSPYIPFRIAVWNRNSEYTAQTEAERRYASAQFAMLERLYTMDLKKFFKDFQLLPEPENKDAD